MKVKCKENPFPLFAQNDNFQLECKVRFLNFSLPSGTLSVLAENGITLNRIHTTEIKFGLELYSFCQF